ncbi:ATP-binding protein [Sphaerotilus sp.]|jgi:two-component system, sensor histidine kinase|uniref:ATP-binding protein n=1 Tax=Sphaerotilus sp. TaxID=2093942 RepID=UPI0025DDA809|nr:ATP-binding protein [Sphaerotilus sp.]
MNSPASDAPADRVGALYAQLPASLLGQALAMAAIGLLFVVWPQAQAQAQAQVLRVGTCWLLLALLAWAWRWRLHRWHQTQPALQVSDWRVWCRRWALSTLVCAGVWALAVLWLYPLGTDWQRAGLLALLACLGIGSAAAGHGATRAGTALVAVATVWQLWATHTGSHWAGTLAVVGVCVGIALVGHHQRQDYLRLLSFKHRSERLAALLAAEKDIAEEARLDAEAATRARTQFFTAASHDLRQPLHALVLFTESLRLRNRDSALEPPIASIGEAVDALEALFDKLLDLTSIDSGAIVVESKLFHMRELYARLKLHFEPQAFDKGLGLDFVGGRHAVRADPLLVERILRNLVSNAIRYTEDGGVLVSCRARAGRLLIQVWDTGLGIDARLLPSIFDEFYQVVAARGPDNSPRKGLGLGLAIVRRLAELLQAPISVRSRPGHGTVFSLLLPLSSAAQPGELAELAAAPWATTPTWTGPTLVGRHVVLVGAELDAGPDTPGAMLQHWGAQTSAFCHAAQVLDWSASQARLPDLVLIGRMPAHERGGVDLVRALRQVFGAPLPAVLVSDGEADLGHGAEPDIHLLARPVAPNRLRAMVSFKLSTRTISHPDL